MPFQYWPQAIGIPEIAKNLCNMAIRGCIGCRKCRELGRCVFDDAVNQAALRKNWT